MGFQPVSTGMDRQPYNAAYKYLFSSPRIACRLRRSFVDIPLVKKIRPEDLELVEKSFVSDELERRETDVIFKVNHGGKSAYIYILMEFQSSPSKVGYQGNAIFCQSGMCPFHGGYTEVAHSNCRYRSRCAQAAPSSRPPFGGGSECLERVGESTFGIAPSVNLSGVKPVDAAFQRGLYNRSDGLEEQ